MKFMLFCMLLPGMAAVAADDLEGAYERVSLTNTRTGESPEAADRKGLLVFADGHYAMMTMNPERRVMTDEAYDAAPPAERIAYLEEWLDINAHSGRYETGGNSLTWYRDISENPAEVGSLSSLHYEWRNELLVIYFTLPNGDRYDWVWRKLD